MLLSTKQAFELLKQSGLTTSIHIVLRWIRKGELKATIGHRKDGYWIEEEDLLTFIKERRERLKKKLALIQDIRG